MRDARSKIVECAVVFGYRFKVQIGDNSTGDNKELAKEEIS